MGTHKTHGTHTCSTCLLGGVVRGRRGSWSQHPCRQRTCQGRQPLREAHTMPRMIPWRPHRRTHPTGAPTPGPHRRPPQRQRAPPQDLQRLHFREAGGRGRVRKHPQVLQRDLLFAMTGVERRVQDVAHVHEKANDADAGRRGRGLGPGKAHNLTGRAFQALSGGKQARAARHRRLGVGGSGLWWLL